MASTGDDGELEDESSQSHPEDPTATEDDVYSEEEEDRDDLSEISASQRENTTPYEEDDFFDEEDDRDNRFDGADNTWRFFTKDERALAASLDQQRANDLSVHLYNAHALKANARDPEAATDVKPHQSKKRWIKPNEDGSVPWYPEATWTSWPMRPEDVPRRNEQFGVLIPDAEDDLHTYRMKVPWKPSADLESEIYALILRKAKEKFRARQRRQPYDGERPDFLVDDDEAEEILRPVVRHTLSQIDDLLSGLRRSRKGQINDVPKSSFSHSRSKSASAPKARSSSRTRRQSQTQALQEDEDSHAESSSTDAPGYQNEHISRLAKLPRRRPLNPRDWSEVLAVASFTGLDSAVIDRTAQRCSSLFGESMSFTTISESAVDGVLTGTSAAQRAPDRSDSRGASVATEKLPPAYDCPVLTCRRHGEPFQKAWRWREHLKRSHKYSNEEIGKLERSLNGEEREANGSRSGSAGTDADVL